MDGWNWPPPPDAMTASTCARYDDRTGYWSSSPRFPVLSASARVFCIWVYRCTSALIASSLMLRFRTSDDGSPMLESIWRDAASGSRSASALNSALSPAAFVSSSVWGIRLFTSAIGSTPLLSEVSWPVAGS